MNHVLLIDDDVELVTMFAEYLEQEGFAVTTVHNGQDGARAALSGEHAIAILDVMMPGTNGIDALRLIRAGSRIPVLMLTARGDDADRILGLELGADDYVAKPCTPRELTARVRAILRRTQAAPDTGAVLSVGKLTMFPEQRRVTWDGAPVDGSSTASCAVIPEETGGPYPGDGSNRNADGVANALVLSGIVRSDIRASVAGASGVAQGIPLTIRLQLVNVAANCAAAAGAAVYLWHCTREGGYSMYSNGIVNENYLRGVQEADSQGVVSFQTIFPGCYDGRMPHVHFEVYPTLAKASSAANRVKTSQFAFPLTTLNEAYASSGYATSVSNLARISFATDNVFSDGTALQMASVTGNPTQGYVATLTVGVSL